MGSIFYGETWRKNNKIFFLLLILKTRFEQKFLYFRSISLISSKDMVLVGPSNNSMPPHVPQERICWASSYTLTGQGGTCKILNTPAFCCKIEISLPNRAPVLLITPTLTPALQQKKTQHRNLKIEICDTNFKI